MKFDNKKNMSVKQIVLSNKILREIFFFLTGKKLNRKKIDRRIECLFFNQKNITNYNKKAVVNNLIVSFTSFGERIPDCKYVFYSLIKQSIKPEKIIFWLAESDEKYLTDEITQFKKFGIEIRFTKDIKSYKKLIPALEMFPDYYIVTCDDDIYYRKNWLKKLWTTHLKKSNSIVTHIVHRVSFDSNSTLLPYNKWKHNVTSIHRPLEGFPTGGGGTLYHRTFLHNDTCRNDLFMTLAPKADDVWFYFMEFLQGTEVVVVKRPYNHLKYVDIYKEYGLNDKTTLQSENVGESMNDKQIRAVMEYYGIKDSDIMRKK